MKKKTHKSTIFSKLRNAVFTLMLTAVMLCGLQVYSASTLKFAQISDAHFYTGENNTSYKMIAESDKLLDDAINQINEMQNISFVMFTGDQIDKHFEKELKAFLPYAQKLNAPWYIAFGNHDTCQGGYLTPEVYLKMVKEANPQFTFDKPYYSFVPQAGYKAIVLDTIIRDRLTSNGYIDKEQLEWLDKELKNSQKDVVLIFMHVPVIEPFPSPGHKLLNAPEVQEIIEKYKNPIAVFQGHYHAAKITQHKNVLYVSTPSLVSYPNAFRVISISNHRNKVVFDIQMKETNEKNIQKLAKLLVFSSSIYTGEEKDQTYTYTIKK